MALTPRIELLPVTLFAEVTRTPVQPPAARHRRAEAILERWDVHQVKAQDVLDACDRLNAHLSGLWPTGRLHRETPVFARLGYQLVSGRIDLLGWRASQEARLELAAARIKATATLSILILRPVFTAGRASRRLVVRIAERRLEPGRRPAGYKQSCRE